MKRYCKKLLCLLLALALTLGAWLGCIFSTPDRLQGTVASTLHVKVALLEKTESPRIIFAGGSSSPYGMVCQTVADATGRTVINVGATAYLGMDYYISLLTKYVRAGDTVVLAPEHMMLEGDCVDYTLVWQAAGNDLRVWATVPPRYLAGLLCTSDDYLAMRRATADRELEVYHGQFGPLGDVTAERTALLESGWNRLDPVVLNPNAYSDEVLQKINRFAAKMQARGAAVYFAFAPLDAACIQSSDEEIDAYAAAVTQKLTVPVLVTQQQAIYPAEYFYDSNNHLTTEGAAVNTQALIVGLREQGIGIE